MNVSEYYGRPHINLTGVVDAKMTEDLDRQIKATLAGPEVPVVLTLTSPGGGVGYAQGIFDELSLLQQHRELTLVARGICLSSAVTIAMAFPPERRLATTNTRFLIHEGSIEPKSPAGGTLSVRDIQIDIINANLAQDKVDAKWVNKVIAKGCDQPLKEVRRLAKKNKWLMGKEAVKFGLVSGFIDLNESREPADSLATAAETETD